MTRLLVITCMMLSCICGAARPVLAQAGQCRKDCTAAGPKNPCVSQHKDVDQLTRNVDSLKNDLDRNAAQKDLKFQNLRIISDTEEIATLQKSGGNESKIKELNEDIKKAEKKKDEDLVVVKPMVDSYNDLRKKLDEAEKALEDCEKKPA
jgi:chromosome segregation ATPase